jgi:hypothetical protein
MGACFEEMLCLLHRSWRGILVCMCAFGGLGFAPSLRCDISSRRACAPRTGTSGDAARALLRPLAPGSIADRWARTRWSASSTLIIGTPTEDIRNKCALRSFNSHAFTLFPCGINSSEISGETGTGAVKKQAATSRLVKNFGKAIHYHPYYLILAECPCVATDH